MLRMLLFFILATHAEVEVFTFNASVSMADNNPLTEITLDAIMTNTNYVQVNVTIAFCSTIEENYVFSVVRRNCF